MSDDILKIVFQRNIKTKKYRPKFVANFHSGIDLDSTSYTRLIEAIRDSAVTLEQKRAQNLKDAESVENCSDRLTALIFLANKISCIRSFDHAESPWASFDCPMDFGEHFSNSWRAKDGEVPAFGQRGRFFLSVSGYNMSVEYQPFRHGGDSVHFEFKHERSREPMPLTPTGYRSHYARLDECLSLRCPKLFALEYVKANSNFKNVAAEQLSLI